MSGRQDMFVKIVALVVIILAFGVYLYINRGATFAPAASTTGFASKIKPIAYDYNSQAGVYANGGFFYLYTRDGVSYRSAAGEVLWSEPFDITHPEAFGAGGVLAVAELRGLNLRVYNANGLCYSLVFELPILNFLVNESGYSCVKLQDGAGYQTLVFDETGEKVNTRYHKTDNVFPIAAALSKSSRLLALSLLDINEVDMRTHLMFAYAQPVSSVQNVDGVWGAYVRDGQIIASLQFIGDQSLLTASDRELAQYRISEGTVVEGATVVFENEVRGLGYMGEKGVVLAYGRALAGKTETAENTVRFYNAELTQIGEFTAPAPVTYVYADAYGAIIGTGYTYYGFDTKGSKLWQYTAAMELKQLVFLGAADTVLEAGYTEARVLKRERMSADEPVEE